jgi:hypothetical protein
VLCTGDSQAQLPVRLPVQLISPEQQERSIRKQGQDQGQNWSGSGFFDEKRVTSGSVRLGITGLSVQIHMNQSKSKLQYTVRYLFQQEKYTVKEGNFVIDV